MYCRDVSVKTADIERNSDDDDDDDDDNTITYVFRNCSTFNSATNQLVFPVIILLHLSKFQIIHYTDGSDVKFHIHVFELTC